MNPISTKQIEVLRELVKYKMGKRKLEKEKPKSHPVYYRRHDLLPKVPSIKAGDHSTLFLDDEDVDYFINKYAKLMDQSFKEKVEEIKREHLELKTLIEQLSKV